MALTPFIYLPDWSQPVKWSFEKEVSKLTSRGRVESRQTRYREEDYARVYELYYTTHDEIESSALENTLLQGEGESFLIPVWQEIFAASVPLFGVNFVTEVNNFQGNHFNPIRRNDLSTDPIPGLGGGIFYVTGSYRMFRYNEDDYAPDTREVNPILGWTLIDGDQIVLVTENIWVRDIPLGSDKLCFTDEVSLVSCTKTALTDTVHTYRIIWRSVGQ